MMNIQDLNDVKTELTKISQIKDALDSKMESIRSYYKYNKDTDSTSEDLIVSYQNSFEVSHLIDLINELIEYENDINEE